MEAWCGRMRLVNDKHHQIFLTVQIQLLRESKAVGCCLVFLRCLGVDDVSRWVSSFTAHAVSDAVSHEINVNAH